jgi:glycosidase
MLARIFHTDSTATADTLAVERRASSRELDVVSATPSLPLNPRTAPQRRLDGLATNQYEISGLGLGRCAHRLALYALITGALSGCANGPAQRALSADNPIGASVPDHLHVPSPDWRDQIIYFVMIDRFDDGDPGNNNQGANEFNPDQNARYSGGDLAGITRRLDYIRGLGATAVWITPPVRHRWWDARSNYGGYHGYWGEHFMEVDPHFGSLGDYQQLSSRLHQAGMYLVQDIVVNHMGNYFSYPESWSSTDAAQGFVLNPDHQGRTAPTQRPFSINDVRKDGDRAAGIYHWTPPITDYNDALHEHTFQLADLDDLNTETPAVRDALRQSYGYWIDSVGVDAYRVDTAFYVPESYFDDFLNSSDAKHPGILRVAERSGRSGFHVFGEGFGIDRPFADEQARKIDRYMRDGSGKTLLPSMINFPLYGTLNDVFARGRPTAELGHRIRSMMSLHARPHLMPTFVDNHDVDRFLRGGSEAALMQSLLLTMTLPGIPTIYYGTEQGFNEPRGAMFAKGFKSGGRDRFDTDAPLYRFIQGISRMRRGNPVLSRGIPRVLSENAAAAGAFAYLMQDGTDTALIVFNTADHEVLLDNLVVGATPGSVLKGIYGIHALPDDIVLAQDGSAHLRLAARSGQVWMMQGRKQTSRASTTDLSLLPLGKDAFATDFEVRGKAEPRSKFQLVVDGDLARAPWIEADADGEWQGLIDTGSMISPAAEHSVVAWDGAAATQRETFHVTKQWALLIEQADPVGDDNGPDGRYRYPDDPSWTQPRPLDIHRVRVSGAGGALRIELKMNQVVAGWNPANGFDHVAFTLSFEVPGKSGGTAVLPLQNADLPDGMHWHYRLRTHGWSNAFFEAPGATRQSEGRPVVPGADLQADRDTGVVRFTVPAAALGHLSTLSGLRIHINTWDYDGGYKSLVPAASRHSFNGGDGAVDPLIMDSTLIEIP